MIDRWAREYTLKPHSSIWGEGDNNSPETVDGVALPASPDAVVVGEGGYSVHYDKDFWTRADLKTEDIITIDGRDYQVWQDKDYYEYGDFYKYELRADE